MTRQQPFEAVIADMDGVLTRTARLHEQAWKRLFDEFLKEYEGQRPFSSADYRAYVDGKPRYDGVADFLASREIERERGKPSDGPEEDTICGLGNRKNAYFLELLERRGVEVFDDSIAALSRWRRGRLGLAVVSASRNCRRVLEAADLQHRIDVIVDGQDAVEQELANKQGIMVEAARRLGVVPEKAVVLEDATAGVRAGRHGGFGLVVGVSRDDNEHDLAEAGADQVVHSVDRLRFLRWIPPVVERCQELSAWRGERTLAVFLDYDGTLSPIVDDPSKASMSPAMRAAVEKLAALCPVAIVSGRDRRDVQRRVGIEGLYYAGNHGFDIVGKGREKTLPEAEASLNDVERAEHQLEREIGHIRGVVIERKHFSVAVHYRMVAAEADVEHVMRTVDAVCDETALRARKGKQVLEIEPAVDWDKGRAVRWLTEALNIEANQFFLLYIGDDETDEDAFAALEGQGAGIRVGEEVSDSLADYRIGDPEQVRRVLEWLATIARSKWSRPAASEEVTT